MDRGGSVFTRVSRFLEESECLGTLVQVEHAASPDAFRDIEPEDFLGPHERPGPEFFKRMREHFEEE